MSHPQELPYVAFFAAFLVLVTLPWHWRAKNVATLAMVAWLFVINIIYGVDAIIWRQSILVKAVVWCDITSRIIIGAGIALPAACMCISIHLAQVASASHVQNSKAEKRRRQLIELLLCFGVPMLWMGLHYTVQGHRFDIIEDYGCRPNTYISLPAIFLIWVPPLIFSLVTVIYSGLALMHFLRHRITFARLLENSNSGLTTSRYLRLMAMAFTEIIITVVSSSVTLWFTMLSLRPWTNWADVHWNFSRIDTYPTVFLPDLILKYYHATWYIIPVSSAIFFTFFAFGQEATNGYRTGFIWIRTRVFGWVPRPRTLKLDLSLKDAPVSSTKQSLGPFVPLNSAPLRSSFGKEDAFSSLPSYQSAIGDSDIDMPPTPLEKDFDYKSMPQPGSEMYIYTERFAAHSIDRMHVVPIPIDHITAYARSEGSSSYSVSASAPPSPATTVATTASTHTFGRPFEPVVPALTHPHDLA
uniref:Pheromone receptor CPRa1p n=1 Tax=Ganoderma boninense TaxID=34458 RepID=A0A5K1K1F1_9APHY|nr:Pheromone receptor CPRa1p [Ganoderma boninense]